MRTSVDQEMRGPDMLRTVSAYRRNLARQNDDECVTLWIPPESLVSPERDRLHIEGRASSTISNKRGRPVL
jgi:hypothetical protein